MSQNFSFDKNLIVFKRQCMENENKETHFVNY